MSEEKLQYETDNNKDKYDLNEEQNNYDFEDEVFTGRIFEAVMNFLGSIVLVVAIITAIICFIKAKWLGGFSTLFLGIVLACIIFSISKIIRLLTINTMKMTRLEEQLNELEEDGIVNLVIDPNIKMPNRESRRNRKMKAN